MLLELFSFAVVLAMLIPVLSPAADSPAPAQLTLAQTAAPQSGKCLDPGRSSSDRLGESS